ncbi:MAG TPA: class I SAM-dependent methyltransferase [Candidatus Binatia bacterium]|nr:class I SAM-dependent methyltransferase [Candidatus Binatia bacterium]
MRSSTNWNPQSYAESARFVSDLGAPLLEMLDAKPGDSVLDLGCGDGALTEKIAAVGCFVIGMDSSLSQARATQKRGLNAVVADGQCFFFKRTFDAVFSNAALHWMKEAENVLVSVAQCLKPAGRFVGEFGGEGNVAIIRAALHEALRRRGIDPWKVDPWYYPAPDEYAALLARRGFVVSYIELLPRPTRLPGDIVAWLDIFAQPFTKAVTDTERGTLIREVCDVLEPRLQNPDGTWCADYVRLRFKAIKVDTPLS